MHIDVLVGAASGAAGVVGAAGDAIVAGESAPSVLFDGTAVGDEREVAACCFGGAVDTTLEPCRLSAHAPYLQAFGSFAWMHFALTTPGSSLAAADRDTGGGARLARRVPSATASGVALGGEAASARLFRTPQAPYLQLAGSFAWMHRDGAR